MSGFEMWGYPAKFVVEVQMPRAVVRVPLGDVDVLAPAGRSYGEIRIPFKGHWITQVADAVTDVEFHQGC